MKLVFNKPVYLGVCILDIRKLLVYDFYYRYIKPKYKEKSQLLMTDTDSLPYEIERNEFFKDISGDVESKFNTSNFPENHPSLPTGKNKNVIRMLKNETGGEGITEFVGLKSKLYAFHCR